MSIGWGVEISLASGCGPIQLDPVLRAALFLLTVPLMFPAVSSDEEESEAKKDTQCRLTMPLQLGNAQWLP
jgi:hypothetical protein